MWKNFKRSQLYTCFKYNKSENTNGYLSDEKLSESVDEK